MNTLNDALKPCPFCGQPAHVVTLDIGSSYAMCRNDDCTVKPVGEMSSAKDQVGKAEAMAAWNTRASLPESSAAQGAMGDATLKYADLLEAVEAEKLDWRDGDNRWVAQRALDDMLARLKVAQPTDATAQPITDASMLKVIGEIVSELRVEGYYRKRCDELAVGQSMVTYANRIDAALANTAQGKPEQEADKPRKGFWDVYEPTNHKRIYVTVFNSLEAASYAENGYLVIEQTSAAKKG